MRYILTTTLLIDSPIEDPVEFERRAQEVVNEMLGRDERREFPGRAFVTSHVLDVRVTILP